MKSVYFHYGSDCHYGSWVIQYLSHFFQKSHDKGMWTTRVYSKCYVPDTKYVTWTVSGSNVWEHEMVRVICTYQVATMGHYKFSSTIRRGLAVSPITSKTEDRGLTPLLSIPNSCAKWDMKIYHDFYDAGKVKRRNLHSL